jgi:hypothetical protein
MIDVAACLATLFPVARRFLILGALHSGHLPNLHRVPAIEAPSIAGAQGSNFHR